MAHIIQTNPYTLQPQKSGPPDFSHIDEFTGSAEVRDSNFRKKDGHLDEVTPTHKKDFDAQPYNTRFRDDGIDYVVPWDPDNSQGKENPYDDSDYIEIFLEPGQLKYSPDAEKFQQKCVHLYTNHANHQH